MAAPLRPITPPLVAHSGGHTRTFRAYWCPEWEEYQVRTTKDGRPVDRETYHTDDRGEALSTLAHMHAQASRI